MLRAERSRLQAGDIAISDRYRIGRRTLLTLMLGAAARRAAAQQKPKEEAPLGPQFVKLPIFQIPVIEGNEVTRRVSVEVALELVQGMSPDSIKEKQPLLIDAFLRDLYAVFAQRAGNSRVADDNTIRVRLQRIADQVLGAGVVRRVLVLQLFEQPLQD
jgi:hypothetical protein